MVKYKHKQEIKGEKEKMRKKVAILMTSALIAITSTQAQPYNPYNSDSTPTPSQKEKKEFCNTLIKITKLCYEEEDCPTLATTLTSKVKRDELKENLTNYCYYTCLIKYEKDELRKKQAIDLIKSYMQNTCNYIPNYF
jgi:hypothetical protein